MPNVNWLTFAATIVSVAVSVLYNIVKPFTIQHLYEFVLTAPHGEFEIGRYLYPRFYQM